MNLIFSKKSVFIVFLLGVASCKAANSKLQNVEIEPSLPSSEESLIDMEQVGFQIRRVFLSPYTYKLYSLSSEDQIAEVKLPYRKHEVTSPDSKKCLFRATNSEEETPNRFVKNVYSNCEDSIELAKVEFFYKDHRITGLFRNKVLEKLDRISIIDLNQRKFTLEACFSIEDYEVSFGAASLDWFRERSKECTLLLDEVPVADITVQYEVRKGNSGSTLTADYIDIVFKAPTKDPVLRKISAYLLGRLMKAHYQNIMY